MGMARAAEVMVMVAVVWVGGQGVEVFGIGSSSSIITIPNSPITATPNYPTTTTSNPPPIAYVHSLAFGDFIVAPGWATNDPEDISDVIHTKNRCTCRMACLAKPGCQGAVALTEAIDMTDDDGERMAGEGTVNGGSARGGQEAAMRGEGAGSGRANRGVECRLLTKSPDNSTFHSDPDAVYYFWTASLKDHGHYTSLDGGPLYLVGERQVRFREAGDVCKRVPGHRLPMIKTMEQHQYLVELTTRINGIIWVDLHESMTGTLAWVDGTPLVPDLLERVRAGEQAGKAEKEEYFAFHDGYFTKVAKNVKATLVCQTNLGGL
ncbi:uncharacterized protein LOC127003342 [Eriocheir sinensis]|uniref:uncharacterized protein LOC127003342 n=1 Tax=Eriocheir sinensis TaxID=95602 RepID=UPI0021C68DFC|nr:uncharacterized protein LOC127003342 [Eriocheir sinensis]